LHASLESAPNQIYPSQPSSQFAKLIRPDEILKPLEASKERVRVIVGLSEPAETQEKANWKSLESRSYLRSKISERQAEVLSSFTSHDFTIKHRYENFCCFSGEITVDGLAKLFDNPLVISIEPDRLLYPLLAQGIPLINATAYRSTYNGTGIAIAICDTGVDYTHPRLGGGNFPNGKVIGGYDVGDNDPDPRPNGIAHGTACAGIAAGDLGTVGDYIGGVAYNSRIYALKITQGNSDSAWGQDIMGAWDWCITHQNDNTASPIKVISISFGGGQYFTSTGAEADWPSMADAARRVVNAGITILASSGNDGYCSAICMPAAFSSVISVGAVYDASLGTLSWCVRNGSCATPDGIGTCGTGLFSTTQLTGADIVAVYSNTASFLDILAPSNNAYTTDIVGSGGYSSGDYYTSFGGTSAACPYAAGAVACLQQAAKALTGQYLTPGEIRETIISTGVDITDGKVAITKPRVNLKSAIENIQAGRKCLSVSAEFSWDDVSPCDDDGLVEAYEGAKLKIRLTNNCNVGVNVFRATLSTNEPAVNITNNEISYDYIPPGQSSWSDDAFYMKLNFSTKRDVSFTLDVAYMKDAIEYRQSWNNLHETLPQDGRPILQPDHIDIITDVSKGGDNDGIPESGESIEFNLYLRNSGNVTARDVQAKIDRASIGGIDTGQWKDYPDMNPGNVAKQDNSPFRVLDIPRNFTGWVFGDITVVCVGTPNRTYPDHSLFEVQPTPWLSVVPDKYDFGVSKTTNDVIKTVTINNEGTENLVITQISVSQPADTSWIGPPLPWTIPPGGSKNMEVVIETSALQGLITRTVIVTPAPQTHIANNSIVITGLVSDSPLIYQVPSALCDRVDASGNIIVWENGNVYAYDLDSNTTSAICTLPSNQTNVRICGNIVAWHDNRNWNGQEPMNIDVYAYDLSKKQEFPVATETVRESLVGVGYDNQGRIHIAVTRIYYDLGLDIGNPKNLHIYRYNPDTVSVTPVWSTGFTPGSTYETVSKDDCDFGGDIVTWKEGTMLPSGTTQNPRIKKLRLGTDASPVQIYTGSFVYGPFTNDNKIVWTKEDASSNDQVWLWENGSCNQLTFEAKKHANNQNLAVGDSVVVYDKKMFPDYPLFGLNLQTSSEFLIAQMQTEYCRMDDHLLVWRKRSSSEVYYAFLNQADIAVNSSNIIFSNDSPYEGDTIDVNVTVNNLNPWPTTENIIVRLYDGVPNDPTKQLGPDKVIVGGIVSQGSATVEFNGISVGIEGPHNIYACVYVPDGDNPANNKSYKNLIVNNIPPIIKNVIVEEYNGDSDGLLENNEQIRISWNAEDISGIYSTWCTVDANNFAPLGSYFAIVGPLAVGDHNFTIYAMEGNVSPKTSDFSGKFRIVSCNSFHDFALLASQWLSETCNISNNWCHGADLDKNKKVDIFDLSVLAEHWLEGTTP
jgi:subtilisin family serine protease